MQQLGEISQAYCDIQGAGHIQYASYLYKGPKQENLISNISRQESDYSGGSEQVELEGSPGQCCFGDCTTDLVFDPCVDGFILRNFVCVTLVLLDSNKKFIQEKALNRDEVVVLLSIFPSLHQMPELRYCFPPLADEKLKARRWCDLNWVIML